jgi:hypothetical protein
LDRPTDRLADPLKSLVLTTDPTLPPSVPAARLAHCRRLANTLKVDYLENCFISYK